jgi:hypothetical protein
MLYAHLLSDTQAVTTAPADCQVILSLGAGTQSSCLALMAARGDLPASYQRPQPAVFADTGFELRRVYAHLRGVSCLGGETEVITPEGAKPIRSLVGPGTLLVPNQQGAWGQWRKVDVRSFGTQRLYEVTLVRQRSRVRKVIHATETHRWVTKDKWNCWHFTTTRLLGAGDAIPTCRYTSILASRTPVEPSPFGIAHGFVFGDGTAPNRPYMPGSVDFYGTKDVPLLRYFALNPTSPQHNEKCNPPDFLRVTNLPRKWKHAPPLDEPRSYLLGWLAGYFAADGHVTERGQATLFSANPNHLNYVRDLCYVLGVRTNPICQKDHPGKGGIARLHSLTIYPRDLPDLVWLLLHHLARIQAWRDKASSRQDDDWTIASVERSDRVEEVFCAVVPGREMFTLADNIVTGNCPYHDDGYWRALRDSSADEFEAACRFEETIRHLPGVKGECFVHGSCVPLREIDFSRTRTERRVVHQGQGLLFDGGEGACSL